VSGKLRAAIEAMIWEGSCRQQAAKSAGLKDHSLREALRKPHVKAFYSGQLQVLRTSERARNIHALVRVREQDENKMAVVQAVKTLEQLSDTETLAGTGQLRAPGFVIVVQQSALQSPHGTIIEHRPDEAFSGRRSRAGQLSSIARTEEAE
jgi:hypothetical protein